MFLLSKKLALGQASLALFSLTHALTMPSNTGCCEKKVRNSSLISEKDSIGIRNKLLISYNNKGETKRHKGGDMGKTEI